MSQLDPKHPHLLNYQQLGQGQDIILIHGLFGSLENLNMVAKSLANNYRVTSIDVRNHGNSFHEADMNYSKLSQDVINLLDYLQIETCHILGHSMGGKIAIQTALDHSLRVNKLIIADIAPVSYPPHHLKIISGLLAIELSKVSKRKDVDEQLSHYVDDIRIRQFLLRNLVTNKEGEFYFKCSLKFISKCYQQIMKANSFTNNKESIERQTSAQFYGETLFIKGGKSNYILPEHKTVIAKILPNSKAKIIQGVGHWLHAEKPTTFNKITADFLSN